MFKAGKKHPLRENLGENLSEPRAKRGRFDNIVLLRNRNETEEEDSVGSRAPIESPRRILRAGNKRKRLTGEELQETARTPTVTTSAVATDALADENDIISQLTREFKKARLRPVFFTISSFIEQTVDEVGFTVADETAEAGTEVTIRLNVSKKIESDISTAIEKTHEPKSAYNKDTNEEIKDGVVAIEDHEPISMSTSTENKANMENLLEIPNNDYLNAKVSRTISIEEIQKESHTFIF